MSAPRQAVNGSTLSVGFTTKLVTIQSISADGKTAICVDRQNTQVSVPMLVQRSKGVLPAAGETWLVTQDLGQYTFAAFVGSSAAQFQAVPLSSGVYTGGTAPGTPSVGELWVNSSMSNMMTVWNGTNWVPVQFGAVAIQPGSLTGAQLAEDANIASSQVNFTASDIGGITTTISATAPADPSFDDLWYDAANGYQLNQWTGTQWVPYQWGTQAIAARSVTTQLLAAEAVTADEMAAGIIYGGIINGTIVDAATFIGSTFEGTDFLINSAGAFFYTTTPGLGDLLVTITSQPGTDPVGNPYQGGMWLYGPAGSFAALVDNGSEAALWLNPPGAKHLTVSPELFSFTNNQGAASEVTWLVISSGKESSRDDAAIQLYSEAADGSAAAHMIIEFGGTIFAQITKTGLVLPGGGTPSAVAGSAQVYATTAGTLQVVDGVDGAAYGTQRRSLGTGSSQNITSTSPATVFSSPLGNRDYRISGMLILTPNQSAGAMGLTWNTRAASGLVSILTTASTSSTAGTATWSRDGIGNGSTANLGPTMTTGDVYTARFDGYITSSGSDTLQIQLNCGTSGDTFVMHPGSYVDIMPVLSLLQLGRRGGSVKDLQLVGGDLLASGRGFATVTGPDYVRQRVACALSEPYGSDPYNPTWGSALTGWLGTPQNAGTQAQVAAEAQRVLNVLMAAQQLVLRSAALTNTRSQLNSADIISQVNSVTASAGSRPDAVQVTVTLTTLGGTQVQASRTVSS